MAQKQLSKNKQNRGTKSAKHEYLLATKIFCGYCGGSMIGETATGKGGGKFGYYVCRNRKKHIKQHIILILSSQVLLQILFIMPILIPIKDRSIITLITHILKRMLNK